MQIKFGRVLYHIRKEANLSQLDVANIISCSRGTYSCWEHDDGEIPLSKLLSFLNACHISLAAFIKMVQEENHQLALPVHEADAEKVLNLKEELIFISERIRLINQNLIL